MKADRQSRKINDFISLIAHQKALSDALFQSIGEGAIATDKDGNISRVNQVALKLLGYDRKDIVGKWYPATITVTDESGRQLPTIERPITRSFLSGTAVSARCFIRRKDGSLLPAAVTVSPVLLDGKPVGAIEVFRDITDELAVDRMKSEFISLASHQLRTPATAVKTYLALLKDGFGGDLNKQQADFAEMAYASNERQLQIVNDLLLIASTESKSLKLKKELVDIRQLVNEIVKQQKDTIRQRKQSLHLDMPKDQVTCEVDPSFFKMVIDNLLSNASKYTPENGRLLLRLSRLARGVEMAVSDTGVGIADTDMDKLFQKFMRIDNPLSSEAGGTGIGLYLLKQIVELHDGMVAVDSVKGRGTTFTVSLPST